MINTILTEESRHMYLIQIFSRNIQIIGVRIYYTTLVSSTTTGQDIHKNIVCQWKYLISKGYQAEVITVAGVQSRGVQADEKILEETKKALEKFGHL